MLHFILVAIAAIAGGVLLLGLALAITFFSDPNTYR